MTGRRFIGLAAAIVFAAICLSLPVRGEEGGGVPKFSRYLKGQFLVAAPKIGDPRFARTVIYMISHNAEGAMGLIVNKPYGRGSLSSFLEGFDIDAPDAEGEVLLLYGGPVDRQRGFVLHSDDYADEHATPLVEGLSLNTQKDVLKALGRGEGPRRVRFILGYSGWGPSQLEREMARDDWMSAPVDIDLIFDADPDTIWDRVMDHAGIKM